MLSAQDTRGRRPHRGFSQLLAFQGFVHFAGFPFVARQIGIPALTLLLTRQAGVGGFYGWWNIWGGGRPRRRRPQTPPKKKKEGVQKIGRSFPFKKCFAFMSKATPSMPRPRPARFKRNGNGGRGGGAAGEPGRRGAGEPGLRVGGLAVGGRENKPARPRFGVASVRV